MLNILNQVGFDFVKWVYYDYKQFPSVAFTKEEMAIWLAVVGSTLITYYYDDPLYEEMRDFGVSLGLDPDAQMKKSGFCLFSSKACLHVPHDVETSMYYIGDGFTYFLLATSFLSYGTIYDDNRALSVGSQILEGILDIGIVTQVIKRLTGRQTPYMAAKTGNPRGRWHLLPSFATYQSHIPNYDAYPSGHIAATTVAFTIMYENYPEYRPIILTSYGVLSSILMFSMVHLGVHWVSDYPLGIAIGYYFGKVVANRHKPPSMLPKANTEINWQLLPLITPHQYGVGVAVWF